MQSIQLEYRSRLTASPAEVWQWITSLHGIATEMRPVLRLAVPRGMQRLDAGAVVPGKPLFPCWLLLFGVIPVDRMELTLTEMDEGRGFVEVSGLRSMRAWRHERRIEPGAHGCAIIDRLTFEPRHAPALTRWFVRRFFAHRHAVLRKHLGA